MSIWRIHARMMRAERATHVVLAALVLVTAFLAVAAPRALQRMDDRALRAMLRAAPAAERDITADLTEVTPERGGKASTTPFVAPKAAALRALEDDLVSRFGPALRPAIASSTYAARSGPYEAVPGLVGQDNNVIAFDLRVQEGYEQRVRFVAGHAPAPPSSADGGQPLEVAISRRSAQTMHLRQGATFGLRSLQVLPLAGAPPRMRVVGVYEPNEERSSFWAAEPSLISPQWRTEPGAVGPDPVLIDIVSAVVAPGALPVLLRVDPAVYSGPRTGVSWRFELNPAQLTGDEVAAMRRDLDGFRSRAEAAAPVIVYTALPRLLDRYEAQRATTIAMASLGLSGLLVIALAVLALAARLGAERRRAALGLVRARGGSLHQLAVLLAAESALVALPALVIGALLGVIAVPTRGTSSSWQLAGIVALAAVGLVPALAAWQHRRAGRESRRDLIRRRAPLGQLTVEALIVIVAALAAWELYQRGLSSARDQAIDPLIGAVPILVALGVASLSLHLYPLPIRGLERLARRRRSAVPFLGMARAGRESPATVLPLVVLLLAMSLAVFADTTRSTVRNGQDVAAWRQVGADVRLEGYGGLRLQPPTLRAVAQVPGVTSVVPGYNDDAATIGEAPAQDQVRAIAVDVPGYNEILRRSPLRFRFPAAMYSRVARGGEVPVLVSDAVAAHLDSPTTTLVLAGATMKIRVVGRAAGFPVASDQVVIVAFGGLEGAAGGRFDANMLWLTGPGIAPDAVRRAVANLDPAPPVYVRSEVFDAIHDAPLVTGTLLAFQAGTFLAAIYSLIAIRLALMVTARPRERMLSYLRTLGLGMPQARRLAVLEFVPVVVLAAGVGVPLGLALPYIVGPAIDLAPFAGSDQEPQLRVDPVTVLALAVGLVAVVVTSLLLETAFGRRKRLGSVLRVDEEG
jgi:putative ABC transport system permease protein